MPSREKTKQVPLKLHPIPYREFGVARYLFPIICATMIRDTLVFRRQLHVITIAMREIIMIPPNPLVFASLELHVDKVFEDVEIENVYEIDISRMKEILGSFVWETIENNVSELPDDLVEMWNGGYRQ